MVFSREKMVDRDAICSYITNRHLNCCIPGWGRVTYTVANLGLIAMDCYIMLCLSEKQVMRPSDPIQTCMLWINTSGCKLRPYKFVHGFEPPAQSHAFCEASTITPKQICPKPPLLVKENVKIRRSLSLLETSFDKSFCLIKVIGKYYKSIYVFLPFAEQ